MEKKKIILIIISAVLVIAPFVAGLWIFFEPVGAKKLTTKADAPKEGSTMEVREASLTEPKTASPDIRDIRTLSDFGSEKWDEGVIRYDGKIYTYNIDLQNYLFMGIDNDNIAEPAPDGISGGQSDAMFLLSLDEETRRMNMIAINRNTMVPVDVYDREGNFLVQMNLQICLQHGYGDGMKLSCMRSVEAVDRLMQNVPISGYLALNMGGIAAVNDAVGGVELTPIETVERGDIVIPEGIPVKLDGQQAYAYLRTRDVDKFGSANDRLERQKQYITTFVKKVLAEPSLGNRIYEAGKDYIVASIDLPKLINSASDMKFDEDSIYTIKGETVFKDDYEQYNPDEEELIKLILRVFYKEVSKQETD